jgi:hypothetical protein
MAAAFFSSQTDSTGTSVLESRNEAIIAKADRERQRHEERLGRADHEKGRDEHRQDAQHRQQPRQRGLARAVERGAGQRLAARQVRVDVFHRDRGFIDQDADGQRQAAERHQVDVLAGDPQREQAAISESGMLMTTMNALRQSRRKSSTIRPVRTRRARLP